MVTLLFKENNYQSTRKHKSYLEAEICNVYRDFYALYECTRLILEDFWFCRKRIKIDRTTKEKRSKREILRRICWKAQMETSLSYGEK